MFSGLRVSFTIRVTIRENLFAQFKQKEIIRVLFRIPPAFMTYQMLLQRLHENRLQEKIFLIQGLGYCDLIIQY
jgi:hypothetical protein